MHPHPRHRLWRKYHPHPPRDLEPAEDDRWLVADGHQAGDRTPTFGNDDYFALLLYFVEQSQAPRLEKPSRNLHHMAVSSLGHRPNRAVQRVRCSNAKLSNSS
jgi:hypothetical protein